MSGHISKSDIASGQQPGARPLRAAFGPARMGPSKAAALIHRLSGLALALFLPLHFLALGLALEEARFAAFIAWSNQPWVKLSEFGLVTALAIHLAGGLPPLAARWLAIAFGFGLGAGLLFLLNAF